MQLSRRQQLSLAALALLGGAGAHAQSDGRADGAAGLPTQFDSGLLWYQESGNRIRDLEAIVSVRQPLSEDRAWNGKLTLDTVCGGSPIGAIPSKSAQSFVTPTATSLNPPVTSVTQTTTSASGGGGGGLDNLSLCTNPVQNQKYTVAPGDLPIDQSFHDQRVALGGGYETGLGARGHASVGAALSHETDFFSASVNGLLSRDFNGRNTTVALGLNLEADAISPVGGTPLPGSAYGDFRKIGNQSKKVQDLLLGATQVVSRRWITQANVSAEHSSGYQTDPYKIVTVVDAQGYDAAGAYVYEDRPGTRNRYALYWDNKYAFDHDMLEASLRHTRDSWGLRSDTFEMRYRLDLGGWGYFEPHLREYRQSAADFFRFYLPQGATQGYASADPRLAGFRGQTFGLKYGIAAGQSGEFSVRVEHYTQKGSTTSSPLPGLQGLDLYPGMQALMIQAGLRFTF
jgi:hypothetical protein